MKISIIGVGLIGGSIGLALHKRKTFQGEKIIITGIGRKPARLALARKIGAIDKFTTSLEEGVKEADVIFIATPVKVIPNIFQQILSYSKPSAIITDVGSVKGKLLEKIEKIFLKRTYKKSKFSIQKGPFFVGSHPIAGGEKTSVVYAQPDLFKNATVIITPLKKTPIKAINTIKKLWLASGAKVYTMSAAQHDSILARTSHLPHITAYALVNSLQPDKDKNYTGSGWRDTTRIASSAPLMWAEIINYNKPAILQALKRFKANIRQIEKSLSDEKSLVRIFSKAKIIRDSIQKI